MTAPSFVDPNGAPSPPSRFEGSADGSPSSVAVDVAVVLASTVVLVTVLCCFGVTVFVLEVLIGRDEVVGRGEGDVVSVLPSDAAELSLGCVCVCVPVFWAEDGESDAVLVGS